jgi:hypothetical protein
MGATDTGAVDGAFDGELGSGTVTSGNCVGKGTSFSVLPFTNKSS